MKRSRRPRQTESAARPASADPGSVPAADAVAARTADARAGRRQAASQSSSGAIPGASAPAAPRTRERKAWLALLGAALAVKLIALVALHDHPLLLPRGDLDTAYYVQQAMRVAGGDWNLGGEPFFVSPLYIFVLGAIFSVAGPSLLAAQVVQVIGGVAATGLIAWTARQWYGARAGWIAGALAIATGVITFNEIVVLQSAIDPLLTSLWLAALTRALCGAPVVSRATQPRVSLPRPAQDSEPAPEAGIAAERGHERHDGYATRAASAAGTALPGASAAASSRGSWADARWWIAAGVAFGLHGLNRPNVLLCVLALAAALVWLWRWRAGLLRAALVAGGVAIVLGPMAVRNYASFGEPLLVSAHGGLNFYIGNNPDADGTYSNVPGITPSIRGQVRDARIIVEAERARRRGASASESGAASNAHAAADANVAASAAENAAASTKAPVTEGEISSYFYDQAFAWIAAHPLDAATLFAKKLAYTFNAIDLALNYSYTYFARDERSILSWLIVGPWLLVPLGLTGLILVTPAWGGRTFLPWALMTPAYALGVALFFVSGRYRLPLLLPLALASGGLIASAIDRWNSTRSRASARTHGQADAPRPASVPAPAPAPILRSWPIAAGSLLLFGLLANWPLSLDDGRADARTERIVMHIEAGEDDEATRGLDAATASHPQPGLLHYRAARAWHARGALDRAVAEYRRALTFDRDQPEILFNLGEALAARESWSEAVPALESACAAGIRLPRCTALLAHALASSGQQARAIDVLRVLRTRASDTPAVQTAPPDGIGQTGDSRTAREGAPAPGATGRDANRAARDALANAAPAELALLGSIALDLRQPELAEPWLAASLSREPDRADVQEQHGLALMLLDRPREARIAFERAATRDPANASAAYNLAVAHLALGETADARRWVEEALRRNPSYEAAQRLRASLP